MGQMVIGVLYGCEAPKGVRMFDDDADDGGLLERWGTESGERYPRRFRVDWVHEADKELIGYWVLCEHGDEKGVTSLNGRAIALDSINDSEAHARARFAWERFAKWAQQRGVQLPAARLWLAPTEVA